MGRTHALMVFAAWASALSLPAGYGQETPAPLSAQRKFDPKQAIAFPGPVTDVVQGEEAVWVAVAKPQYPRLVPVQAEAGVVRVDPATRQVVAAIPIDGGAARLKVGEGAVWAQQGWGLAPHVYCEMIPATISRPILKIDPATNKVSSSVAVGPHCVLAAVGEGALWATYGKSKTLPESLITGPRNDYILRIDPETQRTVATIPINKQIIAQTEVGGGAVWLLAGLTPGLDNAGACIVRIDPQTNTVAAVVPVAHARGFAVGEGAVWVISSQEESSGDWSSRLTRIDPMTNQATATDYPRLAARGPWVGQGAVCFRGIDRSGHFFLYKIDPQTGRSAADPVPIFAWVDSVGEYGVWGSVQDYHGELSRDRKNPFVWPESYLTQIALPEH